MTSRLSKNLVWQVACCLRALPCLTLAGIVLSSNQLSGSTLTQDKGDPNMSGIQDVLGGQRFLLEEDDVMLLQVNGENSNASLTVLNTSNSTFEPQQSVQLSNSQSNNTWAAGSLPASAATGRMFNSTTDVVVTLTAGYYGQQYNGNNIDSWQINFYDPGTQSTQTLPVNEDLYANGPDGVYSQVVMGDFNGDGLSDALLFVQTNFNGYILWGMNVLTASDPNNVDSLKQGPELSADAQTGELLPVVGTIVTGDFNGDGRDEIAALMSDYRTIQFYSVDPSTFAISPLTSLVLPYSIPLGTLVAGRFRNTTNVELAAIGNSSETPGAISVFSIQTMQNSQFSPAVAQTFSTKNYGPPYNGPVDAQQVFAQAAPIVNWYQSTSEQLVLGFSYNPGAVPTGIVWIGSFDSDFNFSLDMNTDVLNESGCLLGMQVGNFDNQQQGSQDPGMANTAQLLLFENQGSFPFPVKCTPNFDGGYLTVKIVNINIPTGFQPQPPPSTPTNWLNDAAVTVPNFPLGYNALQLVSAGIGDLQGRSLRLGAPEKITIASQIQPDIVLGIPPMHIDFINPNTNILNPIKHPGCQDPPNPCVLNLTVLPSMPAPSVGFSTGFNFSSSSSASANRKSTTSWGVSVKATEDLNISFGDEIEGSDIDIKNTTKYAYDGTVAKQYDTYQGKTDSLTATTGFADHLFYTEKEMNMYYYPVLGHTGCPASNPDCTDSEKVPTYIEFSVPDQVTHGDLDATTLDWYQPVQEPGNVFSYPWNKEQLQAGFGNNALTTLTEDPPPCRGTDTSATNYTATWTGKQQASNTSGSTNALSDNLSVSYSSKAGIKDVLSVGTSYSVDIGASASFSTLNVDTATLDASTGINVNKPAFDSDVADCCLYDFAGYIFGTSNPNATFQKISLTDDQGNPISIQQTGPLFVGFLADPVPDAAGLSCGGTPTWWRQVYNMPDVGVNHPERWLWEKSTQTASFNPADQSGDLSPLDQPFYHMKGFFVTKKGDGTAGPSLSQATAGDQLTLSARVYNFSLVDTNDPGLADPAQAIHVRFYGEYYCSSGQSTENSCVNPQDGSSCSVANLCGNGFLISDAQLASIPGFKSVSTQENSPNWTTASVNFDTTPYPNTNLVFWVVVWMTDAKGNLVAEMPQHGLTTDPSSIDIEQITDVPIEDYSNNVGMYGVNTPFYIFPPASPGAAQPGTSAIGAIALSGQKQIVLGQRDKISMRATAADGSASVRVGYFAQYKHQAPSLFDMQQIPYIAPTGLYQNRVFFSPDSCGTYDLYAEAFVGNSTPTVSKGLTVNVILNPVKEVQGLLSATEDANVEQRVREQLLNDLNSAERLFKGGRNQDGTEMLDHYLDDLHTFSERKQISPVVADNLIAQTRNILPCIPVS